MGVQPTQVEVREASGVEPSRRREAIAEEVEVAVLRDELKKIAQHVASGLEKAATNPNKDILTAYAEVLKAVAEVQKALPTSGKRVISFRLTRHELGVLFVYGAGGLLLLLAIGRLLSGLDWKAENLLTVLLYWSTIVAILLGAETLPKIFGKAGEKEEKKEK